MIQKISFLYFYIFIFVANANQAIDMIIVDKSLRTLQVIKSGVIVKIFSID